jgi:hypothetical protein
MRVIPSSVLIRDAGVMTTEITQSDAGDVVHARISGVMTLADQRALEAFAKNLIDAQQQVRLVVTLEAFEGWEKSESWSDDLQFQLQYGNGITKIAIVGDAQWKDPAFLFVGKGFRSTDVEYFTPGARDAAEAWARR